MLLVHAGNGRCDGRIGICIPYATFGADPGHPVSSIQGDSVNRPSLGETADAADPMAEVELVAELGHAPATVEQLLSLKPGDFIELDLERSSRPRWMGCRCLTAITARPTASTPFV